jgi:starch-binding outer membrane protein, SusD/RagB family
MNMRNILKISAAFLVLLVVGCSKDYLNPVPQTSLSDLSVFDNKDRVVAQVNGMYASVKSGWYLGGRYQTVIDLRSDNWVPLSNNAYVNFNTWNHLEISNTMEVNNIWNQIYASINTINIFMDGLKLNWDDGKGKLAGKITQAEFDQFTSEALALRAMCYFDLVRLYAKPYIQNAGANLGVPLRIKAEKAAGGNDLKRSTVAEVYTQILEDLNNAEPLAISTYGDDNLNTTRIHKNTIIALKVRVLLAKGDWAGVISESAKIVPSTAPFVSASGVANALNPDWNAIWTANTSKESIFSLPNTEISNGGGQSAITWYYASTCPEAYFLASTSPVFAAMNAADVRRSSMVKVTKDGVDQFFLSKFPSLVTLADWCPILRYAEVLLSRAEAIVRSGGSVTQSAVDLLNAVRTRAYPAGEFTLASFTSAADFYATVLQERNFEFLGEGMRSSDLMRLGLDIPAKDGLLQGTVEAVTATSTAYIWPIPSGEVSINKLCEPNP